MNRKLRDIVASKLILDWSPQQISGWLKTQHSDDGSMRVSHETCGFNRSHNQAAEVPFSR